MEKAYAIILNEEVYGFILVDGLKITGAWLDPELPQGRISECIQYMGNKNPREIIVEQLKLHPGIYIEYDPHEIDIEFGPVIGRLRDAYQAPDFPN